MRRRVDQGLGLGMDDVREGLDRLDQSVAAPRPIGRRGIDVDREHHEQPLLILVTIGETVAGNAIARGLVLHGLCRRIGGVDPGPVDDFGIHVKHRITERRVGGHIVVHIGRSVGGNPCHLVGRVIGIAHAPV